MIVNAMKRNFEYERGNAKQTFSKKGGRPSVGKTSKGPKRILFNTDEFGKPIVFSFDSLDYDLALISRCCFVRPTRREIA
jgi:hypothetical protein